MLNTDPEWLYWQQRLQNAVDGSEVKANLITCLQWLAISHAANMQTKINYYAPIVNWDPGDPDDPVPPPPGWTVDENGNWVYGD